MTYCYLCQREHTAEDLPYTVSAYRRLYDDHVQITADISAATAKLDIIAMRLNCTEEIHKSLWQQARFLGHKLDTELHRLKEGVA